MQLNDVRRIRVPRKDRNRIGRGPGSGWGVTAGRGYKGQGKRTGKKRRLRFEGGQMALYRRLPKKGFGNHAFRMSYHVVNVGQLEAAFAAGETVDLAAIQAKGLAPKKAKYLKILGFGKVSKPLAVRCHGVSGGAREKVEGAKGTLEVLRVAVEHRAKGQVAAGRTPRRPSGKSVGGKNAGGGTGGAAK